MATSEITQAVRSLTQEQQAVVMALTIITDRVKRLPQADADALYALLKEWRAHLSSEDADGILRTMSEILDNEPTSVAAVDLGSDLAVDSNLEKWSAWVAKRIKDAREKAGLTQEQLSEKTGLPQSHISRIENAKHSPSRATVERIAIALYLPVSHFDCD